MGGGLCAGAMLHWKCNAPSHKHAARPASFHHGRSDDEEEEEGGMDLATLQAMMVEVSGGTRMCMCATELAVAWSK